MIKKSPKDVFVLSRICYEGFHIVFQQVIGVWNNKKQMLSFAKKQRESDTKKLKQVNFWLGQARIEYKWEKFRVS